MTLLETAKAAVEKLTGMGRPAQWGLVSLVRARKANAFRFCDDGFVPNHPAWPLIVYRSAVVLETDLDPAGIFEDLFGRHGWSDSWRNGIYSYVHYHSRIHEVLGVARGNAKVRFGGRRGRTLTLKAGDVAVLPAGTGHQCLSASDDFLVVGAYPLRGTYDECSAPDDRGAAIHDIPKVVRPSLDPVYGRAGSLAKLWTKQR